jgi:hypothetical protein
MYGPTSKPNIVPRFSPPNMRAMAPERSLTGNIFETMSVAAEGEIASPTPTKALAPTKLGTEKANAGMAAVARDQVATPAGRMTLPPRTAVMKPPGSCVNK